MVSCWSSAERRPPLRLARGAVVVLAAVAGLTSGCMPMYLRRDPPPVSKPAPPPPPSPRAQATGSLWRDDVSANYLFSDTVARFAGDLLTIDTRADDPLAVCVEGIRLMTGAPGVSRGNNAVRVLATAVGAPAGCATAI